MKKNKANNSASWGFWLWLVSCNLLLLSVVIMFTAWAVHHVMNGGSRFSEKQSAVLISIANIPGYFRETWDQFWGNNILLVDKKNVEKEYWKRYFPSPEDNGYLLLSALDPVVRHCTVRLLRINDGKEMAHWDPDWSAIGEKITDKQYGKKVKYNNLSACHPVLLEGGDIIFNTGNAMVRLTPCNKEPVWVLDEVIHHSNELDEQGNIWTGSVSYDGFSDNEFLRNRVRDDALALVGLDGRLLKRISLVGVLRRNGLEALLMGRSGVVLNPDPIHLNQVSAANFDSDYWENGDLLISARHLSAIFIYRPSTDKIIWFQTGPWMNQHSAQFVNDHQISVFDNHVYGGPVNIYGGPSSNKPFIAPNDHNRIFVYDFRTKDTTEPYAHLLQQERPQTITEGRAQILPDGGLFVEETNYGRHLRFAKDRLLWSRINDYDDAHIGMVSWSRYLTAAEVQKPLENIKKRQCAPF